MIDSKNKLMQICARCIEIAREEGMKEAMSKCGVKVYEILEDELWTVSFKEIELCFKLGTPFVTYPLMMSESNLPILVDDCEKKLLEIEKMEPEIAQKVTDQRIQELRKLTGIAA